MNPVIKFKHHTIEINAKLLDQQGCWCNLAKIVSLHKERLMVEELMLDNPADVKELFKLWTEIQFDLQEAWGFEKIAYCHRSHLLPLCTCPVSDNEDYFGTGWSIVAKDCPIHN